MHGTHGVSVSERLLSELSVLCKRDKIPPACLTRPCGTEHCELWVRECCFPLSYPPPHTFLLAGSARLMSASLQRFSSFPDWSRLFKWNRRMTGSVTWRKSIVISSCTSTVRFKVFLCALVMVLLSILTLLIMWNNVTIINWVKI